MANGTQLGADNFTRANENPLSQGGLWTTISGFSALKIVSNLCEATAASTNCGALYTGVTSSPDQYCEIVLGAGLNLSSSQILLLLRSDASRANAYACRITGTTITIFKVVSGTPTQIFQATGLTFATNDIIRFTAFGVNLVVQQNFAMRLAGFDNAIASGETGLHIFAVSTVGTAPVKEFNVGFPALNFNGPWTKQGNAIVPTTADINGGSIFSGISNQTMLYDNNVQIITPNADGNVFKMWFMGGNSIFYAESNTCLPGSFTRRGTAVLTGVGIPRIFKNGSTYHLFVNSSPTVWTQIDHYTSTDGIAWTLLNAAILTIGGVGQFDHTAINYLSVIDIIGGIWTALYSGQNGSSFATGLATSSDGGVTWVKSGSNPVMSNYGVPEKMYKFNGLYYGWLSRVNPGVPDSPTVRLSTSDFITDWTTSAPVFAVQTDNAFEGVNHIHGEYSTASVIQAGNTTYLVGSVSQDDSLGSYHLEISTAPYSIPQLIAGGQEYFGTSTQVASDNFTRANENPLSQGGNWTTAGGMSAAKIVSNIVQQTVGSNCGGVYTGVATANDHYSEIILQAMTAAVFVSCRWSTSAFTGYLFSIPAGSFGSPVNVSIQRYNATVLTTLNTGFANSITFTLGDKIRFSVTGDGSTTPIVLSAYQNGSLIMQVYDFGLVGTQVTSGFPGFILSGATPGNSEISGFTAGNANVAYVPGVVGGATQPFGPVFLG